MKWQRRKIGSGVMRYFISRRRGKTRARDRCPIFSRSEIADLYLIERARFGDRQIPIPSYRIDFRDAFLRAIGFQNSKIDFQRARSELLKDGRPLNIPIGEESFRVPRDQVNRFGFVRSRKLAQIVEVVCCARGSFGDRSWLPRADNWFVRNAKYAKRESRGF